jgi:hypothetical protein
MNALNRRRSLHWVKHHLKSKDKAICIATRSLDPKSLQGPSMLLNRKRVKRSRDTRPRMLTWVESSFPKVNENV